MFYVGITMLGVAVGASSAFYVQKLNVPKVEVALVGDITVLRGDRQEKRPSDRYVLSPLAAEMALHGMKIGSDSVLNGIVPEGTDLIFNEVHSIQVSSNSLFKTSYRELSGIENRPGGKFRPNELRAMCNMILRD
jgi:ABC-type xylose transport system permease subunit